MSKNKDMIIGAVRTKKIGSECTFEVCTRAEWEAMSEDEQNKALVQAMWDSEMMEVAIKEQ